jgi:hypothetical protein
MQERWHRRGAGVLWRACILDPSEGVAIDLQPSVVHLVDARQHRDEVVQAAEQQEDAAEHTDGNACHLIGCRIVKAAGLRLA